MEIAISIAGLILTAISIYIAYRQWKQPRPSPPPPPSPTKPPPNLLFGPAPVPKNWVGRREELGRLLKGFRDPEKTVIAIGGPGGIGKTYLGARLYQEVADKYKALWASARERDLTLDALLAALGEMMDGDIRQAVVRDPARRAEERTDAAIDFLEEGAYALFFDDYHLAKDPTGMALFLRKADQSCQRTKLVLMARRRPEVLDEVKLPAYVEEELAGLKAEEAREYLGKYGLPVGDDVARRIWAKAGRGDPTAMKIFATRARKKGYSVRKLLDELPFYSKAVTGEWLKSLLDDLSPGERELALAVSVFQEAASPEAIAHVYGKPGSERLMDGLADWYILDWDEATEVFTMHALLRDYCYHRALGAEARARYHRRAVEHFTALAARVKEEQAGAKREEWPLEAQRAWVEPLSRAFHHAYQVGDWERVIHLAYQVEDPLVTWGLLDRATEVCQQALEAAQASCNRLGEAKAFLGLASIAWAQDKYEIAEKYAQKARRIAHEIEDYDMEVSTLLCLGEITRRFARYVEADKLYHEAIEIAKQSLDNSNEALALYGLGQVLRQRASYSKAYEHYQKALLIFHNIRDYLNEAWTLRGLGRVLELQGRYTEAKERYQEAQDLFRKTGGQRGEAWILRSLGDIELHQAQFGNAKRYYKKALSSFRLIGDQRGQAWSLWGLGKIAYQRASYDALGYYRKALAIFQEIEDNLSKIQALHSLGRLWLAMEKPAKAVECYTQAAETAYHINAAHLLAEALAGQMHANVRQSDIEAAITAGKMLIRLKQPSENESLIWGEIMPWNHLTQALLAIKSGDLKAAFPPLLAAFQGLESEIRRPLLKALLKAFGKNPEIMLLIQRAFGEVEG